MTPLTLTIPGPRPGRPASHVEWWTSNDRPHWQVRRRRTEAVRTRARLAARTLPPMGRIALDVAVSTPTARRFDPHNIAGTVLKAAIDGLVDAGVIPDDDAAHLTAVTIRRGTPTGERGTYQLTLTLTPVQIGALA